MRAFAFLLLIAVVTVVAAKRRHRHSSRNSQKVVAVRVQPSVSCATKVGAALEAAGCHAVLRTDVQTNLASMCSFEVMNSCDHKSAVSNAQGFLNSYKVSQIQRPEPVKITPPASATSKAKIFNPKTEAIHNLTGVLDARYRLGLTGKGIKVAIIDTGIYYLHPALGGGFGPGFKVAFGYDLVGDKYNGTSSTIVPDNDPFDNCSPRSHGTHVAGIVAANATDITAAGFVPDDPFTGVSPGVTLGAYRVFGCEGSVDSDVVAAAILRAAQDGADIINLSLGGPGYADDVSAVAAQTVAKAGRIVVCSNGNDGAAGAYATGVPAASTGALGIASFDNPDSFSSFFSSSKDGTLSSFSSPGLTSDLLLKPDVGGIGGEVYSTISPFAAASQFRYSRYATYSGTSMSSPYVAGCLALLLQKRGKIGLDAARAYLQNTATVTDLPQESFFSTDVLVHSPAFQGAGLVNIYKAATTGTLVIPSSLSLNDTAYRRKTETIQIKNNYGTAVTYTISHIPAATANTFNSGDDFVLDRGGFLSFFDEGGMTFTSTNVATVKFGSGSKTFKVTIKQGQAATVSLQIIAPVPTSSDLWPIYGGYISISNSIDKIITRIPYAGVAGIWQNRHIWSRNSSSLYDRWGKDYFSGLASLFGIQPASVGTGLYSDSKFTPLTKLEVVNATKYGLLLFPAASSSRFSNITITYMCNNDTALKLLGLPRTNLVGFVDLTTAIQTGTKSKYLYYSGATFRDTYEDRQSILAPHLYGFDGKVFKGNTTTVTLPAGVYQMKFSAWKNFGSDKRLDVITTPPFQLVYKSPLSKQFLASCPV